MSKLLYYSQLSKNMINIIDQVDKYCSNTGQTTRIASQMKISKGRWWFLSNLNNNEEEITVTRFVKLIKDADLWTDEIELELFAILFSQ